jgi:hypothetical protein
VNYKIKIMTNENPNTEEEDDGSDDIHSDPENAKHLPHEKWHVVEEKSRRKRPRVEQDEENDGEFEGSRNPPVPPIG